MASGKNDPIANLIKELDQEIEGDKSRTMKADEKKLDELAREILRLERDMTLPGSGSPETVRVERLMHFIESKDF